MRTAGPSLYSFVSLGSEPMTHADESTPRNTPGARLRAAVAAERPLQVVGAINAYAARLAAACGFQARCTCPAAASRRIPGRARSRHQHPGRRADRCPPHHRRLRPAAAGGCRHRLGRGVQHRPHRASPSSSSAPRACTSRTRCRPSAAVTARARRWCRSRRWSIAIKAAVDARTDAQFVIMARTDALAVEGMRAAPSSAPSPASRRAPT